MQTFVGKTSENVIIITVVPFQRILRAISFEECIFKDNNYIKFVSAVLVFFVSTCSEQITFLQAAQLFWTLFIR